LPPEALRDLFRSAPGMASPHGPVFDGSPANSGRVPAWWAGCA
jgi:hypothetical protein